MREVEITIRLPEQLIERARAVGVNIENTIADALETDISRREISNSVENQIAEMAADSDFQREMKAIRDEEMGIDSSN